MHKPKVENMPVSYKANFSVFFQLLVGTVKICNPKSERVRTYESFTSQCLLNFKAKKGKKQDFSSFPLPTVCLG